MEKYLEIIKALEACSRPGEDCPTDCPYKLRGRDGRSCRATLCIDAAEALAAEEMRADEYQEQSAVNAARANENMAELCRTEGECEALRAEAEKLREELKNRPEVGFDADAFDFALARITRECEVSARVSGAAKYWRGFADGLKWCFRAYFKDTGSCTELSEALMRKKMEEGGDDV